MRRDVLVEIDWEDHLVLYRARTFNVLALFCMKKWDERWLYADVSDAELRRLATGKATMRELFEGRQLYASGPTDEAGRYLRSEDVPYGPLPKVGALLPKGARDWLAKELHQLDDNPH